MKRISLTLVTCSLAVALLAEERQTSELTIGSIAPTLAIEHWVQDGKGEFKSVTEFTQGRIYVIEFWATWCGPCISSMPHLRKLQLEYAKDRVQLISISDEDLETVNSFLDKEVPERLLSQVAGEGKDPVKSFRDLTSVYCLTTDPDRSAHRDYMLSAGERGIPCSFLVGKSGLVEWIGHPMSLEEPLLEVIAGTWDREKYKIAYAKKQETQLAQRRLMESLQGKTAAEVDAILVEKIASSVDRKQRTELMRMRFSRAVSAKGDPKLLLEATNELLQENKSDAMQIGSMVVKAAEQGLLDDSEYLDRVSAAIADQLSTSRGPQIATGYSTIARLQELRGDLAAAITAQEKAVDADGGRNPKLEQILKKLKGEAK